MLALEVLFGGSLKKPCKKLARKVKNNPQGTKKNLQDSLGWGGDDVK